MVQNPACNAEDMGSIPGQGTKIPAAVEQPRVVQLLGRTREPCAETEETKSQHSQVNKIHIKKKK